MCLATIKVLQVEKTMMSLYMHDMTTWYIIELTRSKYLFDVEFSRIFIYLGYDGCGSKQEIS